MTKSGDAAVTRRIVPSDDGTALSRVERRLAFINQHDSETQGFIYVMSDEARAQAASLDALIPEQRGPLHGMILSIKDTIDVCGVETTAASRSMTGQVADVDSSVVARLRNAGAIIIGKANCHEFAFGGPSFDLPFPPARNPWDTHLFPGGSSSGSGVTVAAGYCDASIGTDTAGSIRLPSTHCGIAGLKMGWGAAPMDGVHPLSPYLDSVGPLARSVSDCARLYKVMAQQNAVQQKCGITTLGLPSEEWLNGLECDEGAVAAFKRARMVFADADVRMVEINLPPLADIHAASAIVMMREVADSYGTKVRSNFTKYGSVFRNRVLVGEDILNCVYHSALEHCAQLEADVNGAMNDVHAILLPGYPSGPGLLQDVDKFYFLATPNINMIANCARIPALSLPVLRDAKRRPFGIQLLAPREKELELLFIGEKLESLLAYDYQNPFIKERKDHNSTRRLS